MLAGQVGPLLGPVEIAMRLGAAGVLGVVVALSYRRRQQDLAASRKLVGALVMIAMIVSLVLMVIDTSLARAFGLVGALAIIRFRTPVKDMTDIVFLFLAIGAGIATGAGQFAVAFLGVPAILIVGALVPSLGLDRSSTAGSLLLKLALDPGDQAAGERDETTSLASALAAHCESYQLLELHAEVDGPREAIYRVRPGDAGADALVDALTALPGVRTVVLLSPAHELDLR